MLPIVELVVAELAQRKIVTVNDIPPTQSTLSLYEEFNLVPQVLMHYYVKCMDCCVNAL